MCLTSLWVLAGNTGMVSSTVASKVLSASPTSWEETPETLIKHTSHRQPSREYPSMPCSWPSPWGRTPRAARAGCGWTSRSRPSPAPSRSHTPYHWSGPGLLWEEDWSPEAGSDSEDRTALHQQVEHKRNTFLHTYTTSA